MGRPRRISDEEILLGVRLAVLEQGPQVSMDVVADRLGVTAPALFRRFGSRNDLLTAALKPEERPSFIDDLERGPDDRPVKTQLVELFTLIGTFTAGALPCMSALRESGIQLDLGKTFREPPPLRAVRALSGWLSRARAAGLLVIEDPEGAATAMLGAIQAPVFFRHLAKHTDPWDPARNARELAQLFLVGVAPPAPAPPARSPIRTASRKTKEL
jgi:AcrR family transcriptional regulator